MIHVIATIQLAAGRRADFLKEFHAIVPLVRAEKGCVEYGPTVDYQTMIPAQIPMRPDVVTVIEKWASIDALQDHLMAPHMLTYRAKVKEIVTGVQLQVLEPA
jgi:quinol monooxygenase YgiN